MKLVPLEPDPRYGRLAMRISVIGVLALSASGIPLGRLQLGEDGWRLLVEDLGPLLWSLGALGGAGAVLLLSWALWLHRRPHYAPVLLLVPCALTLGGVAAGLGRLPAADLSGGAALVVTASSLAAPMWALALAGAAAAGGALILGAGTLRRARTLVVPWGLILAVLGSLLLVTSFSHVARLPPRPMTLTMLGAAWLGLLLAVAPFASDAPPDPTRRDGVTLPIALLCAVMATLAATASDALVLRAAALYSQGPDPQAHAMSLAMGGARAATARLLAGALPLVGTLLVVGLTARALLDELRPRGRRALAALAVALFLVALALGAAALHRHQVNLSVTKAAQDLASPAERASKGLRTDRRT